MIELTDLQTNNNHIRICANPQYYDYEHFIDFDTSNQTFELVDGAGQNINLIIIGTYTLKPNQFTLIYNYEIDNWTEEKTLMNDALEINYIITKEDVYHNCPYSNPSDHTKYIITLDKNPFYPVFEKSQEKRAETLYYILQYPRISEFPLIFYN